METGGPALDPREETFLSLHARLIVSRREKLNAVWNHQTFCSPFWRLYVNKRAGAFICHDSRTLWLQPGRMYLLPAWLRFDTGLRFPERSLWQDYLHFDCPGLPPTLQRRLFDRPLSLPRSGALALLCDRWQAGLGDCRSRLADSSWAQALAQAALASALEMLPAAEQEDCLSWLDRSGTLGPVLLHIDRHLQAPPSNAELAGLCHQSTDHFIRTFRRRLGVTPAQYGLDKRITAAAAWLAQTPRTLEDIAEAAGFTDRFHFSRSFKARLGVSPAAYRSLHRAGGTARG
jgi:AraC-like DNA-binding protein